MSQVFFFFTFNAHESHSREAASLFRIYMLEIMHVQPSTDEADRRDYDLFHNANVYKFK